MQGQFLQASSRFFMAFPQLNLAANMMRYTASDCAQIRFQIECSKFFGFLMYWKSGNLRYQLATVTDFADLSRYGKLKTKQIHPSDLINKIFYPLFIGYRS